MALGCAPSAIVQLLQTGDGNRESAWALSRRVGRLDTKHTSVEFLERVPQWGARSAQLGGEEPVADVCQVGLGGVGGGVG